MNQQIQILDGYEYDQQLQQLKLTAVVMGQLIECYITDLQLTDHSAFYQRHQFDIEEALCEFIEQQHDSAEQLYISARDLALI